MKTFISYRVLFTSITANGDVNSSTKWYENDYECDKWMSKLNARIEVREVKKESNSLKNTMNLKFNNN